VEKAVDKKLFWVLTTLSGLLVGILIFYAGWRHFGGDEIEAFHSAWKIYSGERIYVDFFQHHHPFLYYLILPLLTIWKTSIKSIFLVRYFVLGLYFSIAYVTYLLGKKLYNPTVGWISSLLLMTTTTYTNAIIEIRPDVPQILCGMIAVYCLFSFFDTKKLWYFVTSAFFLSLSFLFLQKAIFLIFLVGLILLYKLFTRQVVFGHLVIFSLVFLVV